MEDKHRLAVGVCVGDEVEDKHRLAVGVCAGDEVEDKQSVAVGDALPQAVALPKREAEVHAVRSDVGLCERVRVALPQALPETEPVAPPDAVEDSVALLQPL